jgi:carbon-monoxide dehydrogenase medium subunit
MIPAAFDYEVASSVDDAIRLLGQSDDAKILAGGHSLLPLMKLRFARPALLVDIGRIGELSYIKEEGDRILIGAGTRHHDVATSKLAADQCAVLARAAAEVGDPQVRHRGTLGGSVAHGDPASDMPTVLLALDAELVAQGPDGERTIAAADFFTGFLETALSPQEVLTEIRVPKLGSAASTYVKFNRRAQDWATVGVAALVRRDNGDVEDARIALTNMGPTPLRAEAAEQALRAGDADPAAQLAEGTEPPTDTGATAEFRAHLARVVGRRAIEEAMLR